MIRLRDNHFDKNAQKIDNLSADKLSLLDEYSGSTLAKLREKSNGNLITLGRVKKESEEDPAFFTRRGEGENCCLETSNLMGVLRLRDHQKGTSVQIEVHSRFDEDNSQSFLNYLLSKVFRVDFIGSAAKGNDQLWDILQPGSANFHRITSLV